MNGSEKDVMSAREAGYKAGLDARMDRPKEMNAWDNPFTMFFRCALGGAALAGLSLLVAGWFGIEVTVSFMRWAFIGSFGFAAVIWVLASINCIQEDNAARELKRQAKGDEAFVNAAIKTVARAAERGDWDAVRRLKSLEDAAAEEAR